MGRRFTGQALALAIGLAPVLLALLTWTPHGPERWMTPVRIYAVPVLVVEGVMIITALATGLTATIKRIRLPRPAAIAAAMLAIIMVGTIPFAPVPADAATFTALWVIHIFFALSVVHLASRFFTPLDLVRGYAVGFALFCGLFALLLSQLRDPGFDWVGDLPAFGHVRISGHYAAPAAGMATGMMAIARTRWQWGAAFALAILACALAFWSGSRGALVGAAAGLAAGLLFAPRTRQARVWGGFVAGVLLAWLAVSNFPAPAPSMGSERIVASTLSPGNVTTGRTKLWPGVARAVAQRPLFGHGEGQMYYVAKFHEARHPHNAVLQVLLAWGIVGLACVLTLAFTFARATIRLVGSGADDLIPPSIAMAALAVPSLVDGSLFHVLPVSIFAACAGMIGARMLPKPAGP